MTKAIINAWMTILNRLPTKDRLKALGLEVEEQCCFCHQRLESRNHVFLGCDFTKTVWQAEGSYHYAGLIEELGIGQHNCNGQ